MKTRFFSLFILFFPHFFAQSQNLVPNGSFEEFENGCPENLNEAPTHWSWWLESPNSFSTCVEPENHTDSLGWAPWNGFGYQEPYHGASYAGFAAFGVGPWSVNFREYLGCALDESLVVGETYYVSFKTSMAYGNYFYPTCASNRIGVYFTTQAYSFDDDPLAIPNYSHVYEINTISDTTNWTVVQGSFVADQPYTHMGMGVFFEYDQLSTLNMGPMDVCLSYYYLDDVCVSRSPDCLVTTLSEPSEELELIIYPNPANGVVYIKGSESLKSFQLVDLTGSVVLQNSVLAEDGATIDMSGFSAGLYYVILEHNQGIKREKLLIVR